MIKITDSWVVEKDTHTTYYYTYEEKNKTICVSKCVRKNGEKTYCMSNDLNPYLTYGSQEEIKKIVDEIENQLLCRQIKYAISFNENFYKKEASSSLSGIITDINLTYALSLKEIYNEVEMLESVEEIIKTINKKIAYYDKQVQNISKDETKRYWKRHIKPLEEILGYIRRVEKE